MPKKFKTVAVMLLTIARMTEEAATLLQQSTPGRTWKQRRLIEERVSQIYGRIAELDGPIIATRGSRADGIAKIKIARDLAADDHRLEVFFAYLESGLADIQGRPATAAAKPTTAGSMALDA